MLGEFKKKNRGQLINQSKSELDLKEISRFNQSSEVEKSKFEKLRMILTVRFADYHCLTFTVWLCFSSS